jgi:hypothetical protein
VNRVVLALIGGVVGLMSVALLGDPRISPSMSQFDVFGYMGLFLATVLLRALVTVMRD